MATKIRIDKSLVRDLAKVVHGYAAKLVAEAAPPSGARGGGRRKAKVKTKRKVGRPSSRSKLMASAAALRWARARIAKGEGTPKDEKLVARADKVAAKAAAKAEKLAAKRAAKVAKASAKSAKAKAKAKTKAKTRTGSKKAADASIQARREVAAKRAREWRAAQKVKNAEALARARADGAAPVTVSAPEASSLTATPAPAPAETSVTPADVAVTPAETRVLPIWTGLPLGGELATNGAQT